MMEIRTEELATLQKMEAELIAKLTQVRREIEGIVSMLPAKSRCRAAKRWLASSDVGRIMDQVLGQLEIQFTSVDIFETAKKMQPNFDRKEFGRAVNWLQRTGAIMKIEAGRGWRPARFQKRIQH
jgi:Tfp pilus assembly major pilin PilA